MKIVFAGTTLGDDADDAPIRGLTINGQTAFEAIDIVLAARKKFFARGNEAVSLQFSVRREFSTHRESEVFALTHFSALPKSGVCTITCGLDAEETADVFLANAILAASPQGAFSGVESIVQYQIVAPFAESDAPPGFLSGSLTDPMILYGSAAITSATESVDVLFATPFSNVPVITPSVAKPNGGDNLWATIDESTVSVAGFTAYLSAPAPAAGYKLKWIAVAA